MPLRERLHDRLDMAVVVGPLRHDVIDALPDAVRRHIADPAGAELHRRASAVGTWSRLAPHQASAVAGDAVRRDPRTLGAAALGLAVSERGYSSLPISILCSGDHIAVLMPHDLFDEAAVWFHLERILAIAAGAEQLPRPERPLRSPVWATARAAGLTALPALRAARRIRKHAERSTDTAPQFPHGIGIDRGRRLDGLHTVRLSPAELEVLDRIPAASPDRPIKVGRAMKLSALGADALAAAIDPRVDFRLRMNIDLRRYAPAGRRVEGPFTTSYPIGTLRTVDRSPAGIAGRMHDAIHARAPLAALLGDLSGLARTRLHEPLSLAGSNRILSSTSVGISVFPSRVPESAWITGTVRTNALLLIHPGHVSGPYLHISDTGDGICIALWDEVGAVDPERFAAHIRQQLAAARAAHTPYLGAGASVGAVSAGAVPVDAVPVDAVPAGVSVAGGARRRVSIAELAGAGTDGLPA